MKKIVLLLISLLLAITSCVSSLRIVGDEYVVVSVIETHENLYNTKYCVRAVSTNNGASSLTATGNKIKYYTNELYTVGDTLKIVNCHEKN